MNSSTDHIIIYERQYNQSISGDTVINNNTYHKIEETSEDITRDFQNSFIILSDTFNGTYYVGSFREDSSRKIFYFPSGASNEQLLYDFSLSVGDSFQTAMTQGYYLHITSIDSFFDGMVFRKKYLLDQGSNDFLIEGIGSNLGFNDYLVHFIEYYSILYCYAENNFTRYPDTSAYCSLVSINEVKSIQKIFTLSPNPTTEILNLKSEQPFLFPLELLVMDMQGRLMIQKIIHGNDDLLLNVKTFASGTYLLAIRNKESVLYHGFFSKE